MVIEGKPPVYIDETGFEAEDFRRYAYAPRGICVEDKVPSRRYRSSHQAVDRSRRDCESETSVSSHWQSDEVLSGHHASLDFLLDMRQRHSEEYRLKNATPRCKQVAKSCEVLQGFPESVEGRSPLPIRLDIARNLSHRVGWRSDPVSHTEFLFPVQ